MRRVSNVGKSWWFSVWSLKQPCTGVGSTGGILRTSGLLCTILWSCNFFSRISSSNVRFSFRTISSSLSLQQVLQRWEMHQEYFPFFSSCTSLAPLFVLLTVVLQNQSVPSVSNEFQDISVLAWQHLEFLASYLVLMPFQLLGTADAQMEPADRYPDGTEAQFRKQDRFNFKIKWIANLLLQIYLNYFGSFDNYETMPDQLPVLMGYQLKFIIDKSVKGRTIIFLLGGVTIFGTCRQCFSKDWCNSNNFFHHIL